MSTVDTTSVSGPSAVRAPGAPAGVDPMPRLRQTSAVVGPTFRSFSIPTISLSINREARCMIDGLHLNPEEHQRPRPKRTAFNGRPTEPS